MLKRIALAAVFIAAAAITSIGVAKAQGVKVNLDTGTKGFCTPVGHC